MSSASPEQQELDSKEVEFQRLVSATLEVELDIQRLALELARFANALNRFLVPEWFRILELRARMQEVIDEFDDDMPDSARWMKVPNRPHYASLISRLQSVENVESDYSETSILNKERQLADFFSKEEFDELSEELKLLGVHDIVKKNLNSSCQSSVQQLTSDTGQKLVLTIRKVARVRNYLGRREFDRAWFRSSTLSKLFSQITRNGASNAEYRLQEIAECITKEHVRLIKLMRDMPMVD